MERVISVPAAGRYLGLGRQASYDAVRRGELPALRLGRRLVVPVGKLEAMLGEPLDAEPGR